MGVRRSFREGIRLFCREARARCRGRWRDETLCPRRSDSSRAVSGLILETEFNRVGRGSAGTIISSQTLCRGGTRGLRALTSAPGVLGEFGLC